MRLDEAIGAIEACASVEELNGELDRILGDYGFSAYTFVDIGRPQSSTPYVYSTAEAGWQRDYRSFRFFEFDPTLPVARRSNTPFTWSSAPLPDRLGKKKPGAQRVMEASQDYGYRDGLMIPLHFVDAHGLMHSTCASLFWKSPVSQLTSLLRGRRAELHLVMLYWVQRFMDVGERRLAIGSDIGGLTAGRRPAGALTDRERDVISWAGRGKTVSETADILTLSEPTVEGYLRQAMVKLEASNKTHAVAKAISLKLVDV